MGKLFDLESPLMRFLNKMTDLLILNILVIICCIPVVTIGAALTAMHFVLLKMVRGEEGYITKDFFRSFKENFLQATAIWLMAAAVMMLLYLDIKFILDPSVSTQINGMWILVGVGISAIFLIMTLTLVFPVLSHFKNTIRRTLKNSFLLSITILPKTFLMFVLSLVPAALFIYFPIAQPLCFLFFFTAPGYVSAMLYNNTFKKYEPETESQVTDDYNWSVLVDDPEIKAAEEALKQEEDMTEVTNTETAGDDESN